MKRVIIEECKKCDSHIELKRQSVICKRAENSLVDITIMPYMKNGKVVKGVYCCKGDVVKIDITGFKARLYANFAEKMLEIEKNKKNESIA